MSEEFLNDENVQSSEEEEIRGVSSFLKISAILRMMYLNTLSAFGRADGLTPWPPTP